MGKDVVEHHHQEVPYCVAQCECELSAGRAGTRNAKPQHILVSGLQIVCWLGAASVAKSFFDLFFW